MQRGFIITVVVLLAVTVLASYMNDGTGYAAGVGAVGNIDREGNVFTVGAVKQKILVAEREKLDIVFIPARDYTEEIKKMKTAVNIMPITTINETLAILQKY